MQDAELADRTAFLNTATEMAVRMWFFNGYVAEVAQMQHEVVTQGQVLPDTTLEDELLKQSPEPKVLPRSTSQLSRLWSSAKRVADKCGSGCVKKCPLVRRMVAFARRGQPSHEEKAAAAWRYGQMRTLDAMIDQVVEYSASVVANAIVRYLPLTKAFILAGSTAIVSADALDRILFYQIASELVVDLYMISLEVRHGLINHYEDFLSRPWQEHAQSTFASLLVAMISVAFTLNLCVVSD